MLGLIAVGLCAGCALVMAQQESARRARRRSTSLVAAYSFSDPAVTGMRFADRSGHRGMAVGRNVRRAEGRFGAGLAFNGKSSSLTVAGRSVLDLGEAMTLSAWVKPQSAKGTRTIVARLGRGGAAYAVHAATAKGGPGGEARLARGTKRVSVPRGPAARQVEPRRPHLRRLAAAPLRERRGGQVGPMTGSIRDANGPLRIGGRVPGGGWFKGILDEVRVYDRALSAAQIRGAMQRGAPARPAPAAAPALAPAPAGGPTGIPGDWNPVFWDEFEGTALDLSKWQPNWHGVNNTAITKWVNSNEQNCIDPALVSVSGGNLHLKIISQTTTCAGVSRPYRGALVHSDGKYNFAYGYYEARMFLPAASPGVIANWPGWWSVNPSSLPEIDVLEGLGGRASFNYHYNDGGHRQSGPTFPAGNYTGWHTFAANWQPGRIDFYYDGVLVGSQTTGVVNSPHYLILDNVVSAGGPTVPNAEVLVDYARVWKVSDR